MVQQLRDGGTVIVEGRPISVSWLSTESALSKAEEELRMSGVLRLAELVGTIEHVCGVKTDSRILEELKGIAAEKLGKKLLSVPGKKLVIIFTSELVAGGSSEIPGEGSRWPHYDVTGRVFLA